MRKLPQAVLLSSILWLGRAEAAPAWPSVQEQLAQDKAAPNTALERFIRDNQDFALLRPEEANDKIGIPLWLRVAYRREHPQDTFSAEDPTGGYPRVLKNVHLWMMAHPDLQPSQPEPASMTGPAATNGANLRISGAQTTARSESDIRVNFWNTSKIIGASNAIVSGGAQAQFYSSDGGATWGQSTLPLVLTDALHSDPAVDWSSDGTAWSITIGINGNTLVLRAYKSTNGGATWTYDNTPSGSQRNTDKELMWIDHSATSLYKDNVYVIWHTGNPAYVNRRAGGVWGNPIKVSGSESTGTAIGGDITTNSAGDVFAFWPTTGNSKIVLAKSTNGGASFAAAKALATTYDSYDIGVPSFASRRALIYVSAGAYRTSTVNNVYATWTDQTGVTGCNAPSNEPGTNVNSTCKTRIWFARSTDGGITWGAPRMINNQSSLNDQYNQRLAVDETTGKVAVMYYDTVGDPGRLKTDVWYQSSSDGGVTWSAAIKVTTALTNETVAGADSGNQYGDYNGLSGHGGKFFPSWTDRRSGSHEEIWTSPVSDP